MKELDDNENRIIDAFRHKFLGRAESADAEVEIEQNLDRKLQSIEERNDGYAERLGEAVGKLRIVWEHRDELEWRHVVLIAAALLYVLSPADLVPDPIPVVGYADDLVVVLYVLDRILAVIDGARDLIERAEAVARRTIEHGRTVCDHAASRAVGRSIAAVVIGLWGMTTASALSLTVAAALGGVPMDWAIYALVAGGLVTAWNVAAAHHFLHRFRDLPGSVQERLVAMVTARLTPRHAFVVGMPIAVLVAAGTARVLLFHG